MKKWKIAFILSVTVLILSNTYWLYQILDAEVTNTYNGATIESQKEIIEVLGELLIEEGKEYSQKDVLFLLRTKYPDEFIVEDRNRIVIKEIEFKFANDSLVSITSSWLKN